MMNNEIKREQNGPAIGASPARIWVGTIITIAATALAIGFYWVSSGASLFIQPALATLIALALVAGLSTLESVYPEVPVRGRTAYASAKGSLVKLWLGCFVALEVAFLLSNLTNRLERSSAERASKPRVVSFAGKLIFMQAGQRHEIDVSGQGVIQAADQKRGHTRDANGR